MNSNNILLCGSSSFAAKGLDELLSQNGYNVITFNRGSEACRNNAVTGNVTEINKNKFLTVSPGTVINFLLLKGDSVDNNVLYIKSLLDFCRQKKVKHLIHISSISVYKSNCKLINEKAVIEKDPAKKGEYGAWKVAVDNYLLSNPVEGLSVSFVRPGFVLGKGLLNPVVGNAFRTPWNKLLLYGTGKTIMPLTTHTVLHQSLLKLVGIEEQEKFNIYVIVDNHSPVKQDYIKTCSELFGISEKVISLPGWFWLTAGFFGDIADRLVLKKNLGLYQKFYNATRKTSYDSSITEKELGLNFNIDWKKELYNSLEKQELNTLGLGALLHDLGKMKVPNEILNKPGPLNDYEYALMKSHVPRGVEILDNTLGIPRAAIEVARCHHERYSGGGYMTGMNGDAIGLFGMMASIVDCYDAVTSDRVYRLGIPAHEALTRMYEWRVKDFHPALVEQFIQCMGIYPIGSIVELENGAIG